MATDLDRLIQELATGLQPVRSAREPWLLAATWGAACVVLLVALIWAVGGAWQSDLGDSVGSERLMIATAVATALCAAIAAFSVAIPGRASRWALLPLPPLLLWLIATGWDCWQTAALGIDVTNGPTPIACFRFILGVSLPLAAGLFYLLHRAYCVHERLAATLAGLASGTAASAMLEVYHAHGMPVSDLASHFVAVIAVTMFSRLILPPALDYSVEHRSQGG